MTSLTQQVKTRHLPGEEGIWVLILGDMLIFGLFFGTFLFYRNQQPELFLLSQEKLNQHYGAINTLLLLTSSWFVAMAVHLYRKNETAKTALFITLAASCGLGFAVIKIIEFREKIVAGINLTTNDFFMYYFMFTGIHFIHVIIGLVVLFVLWRTARRGYCDEHGLRTMENGASFWHMVDLLWIVLFPLIYLLK
ncbi:MAG: cytochrome c oxidase subunit 3 [Pseudomonadales bacterium]|nr:cytochrome c oxidase subunit 3 [Pseudomonadales bacterium]MCP5172411.1 cytochrome c oxidase subunit 3 [Pseudomonadales bacterium]